MNKLFDTFEKVSLQEWNEKIIKDLKGSNYRKKLVSFTEGIEINPVYSDENIEKIHPINFPSDWISFQEIDAIHAKTANQKALLALNNDVSGLSFKNPNNLDVLLEGISVNDISIIFTDYNSDFINKWKYYCDINNITITAITDENTIIPEGKTSKDQINSAVELGQKHEGDIFFQFDVGSNFFLEIAKLKAFRILWKNKTEKDAFIFTRTSKNNKETEFEYNNLIRTTTECMSSIFGGANGILTHSFSKDSTEFSERIARNQQTILRQESYLNKVKNPAKGAYYVEYLISELLKGHEIFEIENPKSSIEEWMSAEGIKIKSEYKKDDIKDVEHTNFVAGIVPYLRGPYSTMYVTRPWTIRQYAGFSTAEESNAFYKKT